jgi:hypothetical protein
LVFVAFPGGCPLGALDLIEDHQPIEMSAQETHEIAQLSLVLRRFQNQTKGATILGDGLCKRRFFNLPGPRKATAGAQTRALCKGWARARRIIPCIFGDRLRFCRLKRAGRHPLLERFSMFTL